MKKLSKYTAVLASLMVMVAMVPSSAQAAGIKVHTPGISIIVGGNKHYTNSYYNKYSVKKVVKRPVVIKKPVVVKKRFIAKRPNRFVAKNNVNRRVWY